MLTGTSVSVTALLKDIEESVKALRHTQRELSSIDYQHRLSITMNNGTHKTANSAIPIPIELRSPWMMLTISRLSVHS